MPRSLEEVWIGDSHFLCGWVSSPVAVTSSTGCAGNNAVGRGAGIRFDSLEHEVLEDADLLEHQLLPLPSRARGSERVDLLVSPGCAGDSERRWICCSLTFTGWRLRTVVSVAVQLTTRSSCQPYWESASQEPHSSGLRLTSQIGPSRYLGEVRYPSRNI